ncbi:three-helix bundle dimerization domain-containing protein [Geodermatophilus sp. SYSU D01062]
MSVVAEPLSADDGAVPGADAVLGPLVARLSQEYGADPVEVRARAVAAFAAFAGARVQAFVPILVEKRLRERYRVRRTAG